jgi:hypothetical protein
MHLEKNSESGPLTSKNFVVGTTIGAERLQVPAVNGGTMIRLFLPQFSSTRQANSVPNLCLM